ncbi:MAG: hypothetical protein NZL87_10645, partial [Thermomicrobium sp.]|nr:hypothetical protein [Thermomicrobium sp.]
WYSNGSIVTNRALLHYGSRSAPAATLQPTEAAATSRPGADEPSPRPGTNHRTTIPSEVPLLQVQEIPCTLEGALTFQIQNVMCATALALALGIPPSTIRAVTSRFVPSPAVLPGSCNLVPICGREVLIDGAHYPWMLRPLIRGIRQRKPRKTFVLTHDFPWLSEDELREVGRILGRVRGMIVAYGLSSDDRLRTLSEGIAHNVLPPVVVTQPAVEQALRSVLNLARAGDVCLVLASNPEGVIRLLSRLGAEGR